MPAPSWLFDKPAQYPSTISSGGNISNTAPYKVPGQLPSATYQPRQPGFLSLLSNVGTGALAPFLQANGIDNGFAALVKRQQENQMADMEFQKYLSSKGQTGNFVTTDENGRLVVAAPRKKGDVFIDPLRTLSPESKIDLKNQGAVRKDLNEKAPIVNSLLGSLDRMESLIDESQDFKPGLVNATKAKLTTKVKQYSNDPFVSKYSGHISQNLSPLARQVQSEKGPLTDRDIDRITKGIGKIDQPRAVRKELVKEIRNKLREQMDASLQGAGYTSDDLKQIYPGIYNKLYGEQSVDKGLLGQYMKKYPDRSQEEIIRAMQKGKK